MRYIILFFCGLNLWCCKTSTVIPIEQPPHTEDTQTHDWHFENPSLWEEQNGIVSMIRTEEVSRPFRRPYQLGYIRSNTFLKDFEYAAEVKCTDPKLKKGRDVLIVFGYQSPSRFYYVHLSNDYAAGYHNGIFLVNNSDRTRIDIEGLKGPTPTLITDLDWHKIMLKRSNGRTSITVDGQLLMTTTDQTIDRGYVGFGSFDDTGEIRNVEVREL
ncbi:MAG: hypothetical protein ACJA01_004273 [Saprospiraceae bacterium]|jgi:hypothetical protein